MFAHVVHDRHVVLIEAKDRLRVGKQDTRVEYVRFLTWRSGGSSLSHGRYRAIALRELQVCDSVSTPTRSTGTTYDGEMRPVGHRS